jgi:hypothetical protein
VGTTATDATETASAAPSATLAVRIGHRRKIASAAGAVRSRPTP